MITKHEGLTISGGTFFCGFPQQSYMFLLYLIMLFLAYISIELDQDISRGYIFCSDIGIKWIFNHFIATQCPHSKYLTKKLHVFRSYFCNRIYCIMLLLFTMNHYSNGHGLLKNLAFW